MSYIIYSDGREEQVTPINGKTFTLKELQKIVGGYIEILYLRDNRLMVVNEEGKFEGLDINAKATALYGVIGDCIVGNVLVCDSSVIE